MPEEETMEVGVDLDKDGKPDAVFSFRGRKQLVALLGGVFCAGMAAGAGLVTLIPF